MTKHKAKYVSGGGFSDQYVCSCGWKSVGYWDGAEYAYDDWKKHVLKETGSLSKTKLS